MAALQWCTTKLCIQRSTGELKIQMCKLVPRFVHTVLLSLIDERYWLPYMDTSEDGENYGSCLHALC